MLIFFKPWVWLCTKVTLAGQCDQLTLGVPQIYKAKSSDDILEGDSNNIYMQIRCTIFSIICERSVEKYPEKFYKIVTNSLIALIFLQPSMINVILKLTYQNFKKSITFDTFKIWFKKCEM